MLIYPRLSAISLAFKEWWHILSHTDFVTIPECSNCDISFRQCNSSACCVETICGSIKLYFVRYVPSRYNCEQTFFLAPSAGRINLSDIAGRHGDRRCEAIFSVFVYDSHQSPLSFLLLLTFHFCHKRTNLYDDANLDRWLSYQISSAMISFCVVLAFQRRKTVDIFLHGCFLCVRWRHLYECLASVDGRH